MAARSERFSDRFIHALHQLEDTRNPDALVGLFCEDCELKSSVLERRHRSMRGAEAVGRFWREYIGAFREVHSSFESVVETPSCVVLEWHSEGHLGSGEPFSYRGVTVLELEKGRIAGMRAYYDSGALPTGHPARRPGRSTVGTGGQSVGGESYSPRQAGHPMDRSQAA